MIYVSKEKLDRDFERYSIDRWLNTTVSIMGKAAIPIVIIELIIAVAMQDKLQWWISMLIFAVLDFITPFIVCFSLIWINAGIKISKSAGGISAALKTSGTIKRSRPYFILIQNEICSDKVLAEAKRLAETANKQSYEYISSLCHLIGCHTLRCEFDEASACLEEMKKLPETDLISRNDHMIAILDYAMAKAAMNMSTMTLYNTFKDERKINIFSVHPGWIRTDGRADNPAPLSSYEAAEILRELFEKKRNDFEGHRFITNLDEDYPF